ncbi:MAG: phenylalanine--tRNA ligase subunit alpha, partial [Clostridia bacterium]|nr:phenylalanine--tRNA ligase subunit alpha [Clostridia bacterium]
MKEKIESLKAAAKSALTASVSESEIEELRVKYLGKKGELTALLKQMGSLAPEERPVMGQLVNEAKQK